MAIKITPEQARLIHFVAELNRLLPEIQSSLDQLNRTLPGALVEHMEANQE